jgi:dihydrolipoamide dehydrogenase
MAGVSETEVPVPLRKHRYRHRLCDDFVKRVVEASRGKILGAHVIGREAALLIQEIVTLMVSASPTVLPITDGMHIHPALSEVVERAAGNLMPPAEYHARLQRGLL